MNGVIHDDSDDDDDDSDDESFHSVISLSDTNNEWPSSSPCLVSSAATATTIADNGGVQTKNQVTKQNNEPRERAKTTNSINFKPHTPPPPPITNEPVVNSTDNPTTYETWSLLTTTNTTTPQTHNPSSLKKHKHKKRPKIHSISYNHTKDCIILSTSQGCRIRTLVPTLTSNASVAEVLVHDVPFPSPDASKTGGTLLSRMLHRTSLLTVVPISTPRTLSLLDARNTPSSSSSILKTLHFTHAIRRIECTKLYLFVLTADGMLHVFHMNESLQRISSISLLHPSESTRKMTESVYTTYAHSFFDISQSVQEECFLVCRHSCDSSSFSTATTEEKKEFKGNVISVYSVQDMKLLNCVKAHNHHEVVKMCIGGSKKGEQRLATCSSKGTVIRIFGPLPQLNKLYTLYRGSNPCTMYSLSFNSTATIIACSGSTGTIHIFDLEEESKKKKNEESSSTTKPSPKKKSSTRTKFTSVFFPETVSDKTESIRSFAKIRLKKGDDDNTNGAEDDDEEDEQEDDGSVSVNSSSPKRKKKKKKKKKKISPNVICILNPQNKSAAASSSSSNTGTSKNDTLEVAVCTEGGRLYQYQVDVDGSYRPVTAEDVFFDEDEYEEEYGVDC
uniref:Autophagy-related protein 18 n=1 Tax=Ditylum brightwellii TaxID=49249 RepID=A0A7S1Z9G8_9STRA